MALTWPEFTQVSKGLNPTAEFVNILDDLDEMTTNQNENGATKSDAGLLTTGHWSTSSITWDSGVRCSMRWMTHKSLYSVHQCAAKIQALEMFFLKNQNKFVEEGLIFVNNLEEEFENERKRLPYLLTTRKDDSEGIKD